MKDIKKEKKKEISGGQSIITDKPPYTAMELAATELLAEGLTIDDDGLLLCWALCRRSWSFR